MPNSTAAVKGSGGRLAYKTGDSDDVNWSTGTVPAFPFLNESLIKQESVIDVNGIRGTRTHSNEQTREGTYTVGGTLTLIASPGLLETWLPSILGTAKSAGGGVGGADRYTTAETLVEFGLLVDKLGAIFEYRDCQVGRATFSGTKDQPITLALEIQSLEQATESSWDANIGTIAVTAPFNPYVFHDLALTVDGQPTTPANSFTLVIDNVLDVQHRQSQAPATITPQDRIVTLSVEVPFNSGNYTEYYGTTVETSGTLRLTDGTYPCDFKMAHLNQTKQTPIVPGKAELGLQLEYQARASAYVAATAATHDIYVDLDSTT